MISFSRSFSLLGLATLLIGTACSTRNDEAVLVEMNRELAEVGRDLNEASRCDRCIAGSVCPSGMLETFGTCSSGQVCCAPTPDLNGFSQLLDRPPMLAEIETDATSEPMAGRERGLFIEYRGGGRWHLRVSCDALLTDKPCNFAVSAESIEPITELDASAFPADGEPETSASTLMIAASPITTDARDLSFSTKSGADVTFALIDLDSPAVLLDGPPLIFFTLDGIRNGGFTGELSNPLRLRPTSP